jgi:hypothetical protein
MRKAALLASVFIAALFVSGCASAHGNQYRQSDSYRQGYHANTKHRPMTNYSPYRPSQYRSNHYYGSKPRYRVPPEGRFSNANKHRPQFHRPARPNHR